MSYKKFDDQIFSKTNLTVSEVLERKNSLVHKKMYEEALGKYKESIDADSYTFEEIQNSYFDLPSKVVVTTKEVPFTKKVVDLTPYWPEYKFYTDNSKLKLSEEVVATSEIIYKDYIHGTAIIQNKLDSSRTTVPLDLVDDTWKTVDWLNLKTNTFAYRIKNNLKH